jgi:hypothetical protein
MKTLTLVGAVSTHPRLVFWTIGTVDDRIKDF